jgi:hypothetical protein
LGGQGIITLKVSARDYVYIISYRTYDICYIGSCRACAFPYIVSCHGARSFDTLHCLICHACFFCIVHCRCSSRSFNTLSSVISCYARTHFRSYCQQSAARVRSLKTLFCWNVTFSTFSTDKLSTLLSLNLLSKRKNTKQDKQSRFLQNLLKKCLSVFLSVCLSVCLSGLHYFLKLHSKLFTSQLFNFSSILTTKILRCCFWLLKYYTGDTSKKRLLIFVTPEHVDLQNIKLKIGYRSSLYQLFSKRD